MRLFNVRRQPAIPFSADKNLKYLPVAGKGVAHLTSFTQTQRAATVIAFSLACLLSVVSNAADCGQTARDTSLRSTNIKWETHM